MTTGLIAQKYGVPMPETCIKMDWQVETLFSWYFNHEWILISAHELEIAEDYFSGFERKSAPQMHEIAFFLEDKLPTLRLCLEHKSDEVDFCVNVCRSNYAEAYAQIYLEFKNEGVI